MIEAAVTAEIPILCLKNLKKVTTANFGFPTCCLGISKDESLSQLRHNVEDISNSYAVPKKPVVQEVPEDTEMEIDSKSDKSYSKNEESHPFTYLYRKSTKSRVFTPPTIKILGKILQNFAGQDFIELGKMHETKSSPYMNMIVKRISNNPNRKKK